MQVNDRSLLKKVKNIELYIRHKNDAVAFLNEIIKTDIISPHTHIDRYDAISRKELAFLVGLLLKNDSFSENLHRLNDSFDLDVGWIRKTLKELHVGLLDGQSEDGGSFFTERSLIEMTFYEESGFYNDQPLFLLEELYKSSENWIIENKGFSLGALIYFYFAVCETIIKKNTVLLDKLSCCNPNDLFFTLDDILVLGMDIENTITPSREEIDNILKCFSCRPGDQEKGYLSPGDENILNYCPIIEVREGSYWLPLPDLLAISIYLSPLYWMRQDASYRDLANKNIGNDLEVLCGGMLGRVFKNIYTPLTIYKGKNRYTDIDCLAVLDDVAIVIQAKNKKMTPETFSGSLDALKKDFNIVAQQAYDQGERSSIALLNQGEYIFKDTTNKHVNLPRINQVFIICVSSSVYYAGAMQVEEYLSQKNSNINLPIVLSVFDLDLLTKYLTNSYEFIYYLALRVKNYKNVIANDEITPLSLYLFTDFLRPDLGYNIISDDIKTMLDEDYIQNRWGRDLEYRNQFSIRYAKASNFIKLLNCIVDLDIKDKRKAIDGLLSLSIEEAINISQKMSQFDFTFINPEKCGFSKMFNNFGISYYLEPFMTADELLNRINIGIKQYNMEYWIGFLNDVNSQTTKCYYVKNKNKNN